MNEEIIYGVCRQLYYENRLNDLYTLSQASTVCRQAATPWQWRSFHPFRFGNPQTMMEYYKPHMKYVHHLALEDPIPATWMTPDENMYQDKLVILEQILRLEWTSVRSISLYGIVDWATDWLLGLLRRHFPKLEHITLIHTTVNPIKFPKRALMSLNNLKEAILIPKRYPNEMCYIFRWDSSNGSSPLLVRPPRFRDCETDGPSLLETYAYRKSIEPDAVLAPITVKSQYPSMNGLWRYLYTTLTQPNNRKWSSLEHFSVRSSNHHFVSDKLFSAAHQQNLQQHFGLQENSIAASSSSSASSSPATSPSTLLSTTMSSNMVISGESPKIPSSSLEIDWVPQTQSLTITGYESTFIRYGNIEPSFYRIMAGVMALSNGAARYLKLGAIDERCVSLIIQCCPLTRKLQIKSRRQVDYKSTQREGTSLLDNLGANFGLTAQCLLELIRGMPFLRIIKDHAELDSFSVYQLNYSLLCEHINQPANNTNEATSNSQEQLVNTDARPQSDRLCHLELPYHHLSPEALKFLLQSFPALHTLSFTLMFDVTGSNFKNWPLFPKVRRMSVGTVNATTFPTLLAMLKYFPALQVCRLGIENHAQAAYILENAFPNINFLYC